VRILIADDDAVSRRLLEGTLHRLSHDVVSVSNGRQAEDALVSADGPRLAILDWMMPDIDGLEVCRTVRDHAEHYVYVILLTAKNRHEDLVTGLAAQADDFLTKPVDAVELGARIQSGARVIDLQERLLAAQEALRREASHDRLTGLWNRGMILDHLDRELKKARRNSVPVSVLMADIDHFKAINDTYGHAVGDFVLRQTAERLRSVLRESDAVGRYGGEEFLHVLSACGVAAAAEAGERLRRAVQAQPIVIGEGKPLEVTVSVGLAASRPGFTDASAIISAADKALYLAKANGRNRVEVTSEPAPAMELPA
jgi:diguanylate cyclase (GGDEF)-like protein